MFERKIVPDLAGTFNSAAALGFTKCVQVKLTEVARPGHGRFYPIH
jgi:hypothetical protein